ncbi:hypothetical protein U9M48_031135 [Paspalum notatum var. saurae]|uniref:Uncharacterized protein n=1 Tax=Paspalum notatum var. saurae TaxID=547442 RepID=A0AAQ3U214_PASNO
MDEDQSSNNIAGGSAVNMEEWVNILERKRKFYVSMRRTVRPIRDCLICRVPQKILELDRNAYEPISLSIGPYYHGKSDLQISVEKWKCFNYILRKIYESVTGECDSSKLIDRIGRALVNSIGYPVPIRETSLPNVFHHLLHFWHLYLRPAEDTEEPQEHHRNRRYYTFLSYFRRYEKLHMGHTTNIRKVSKSINSSRFSRDRRHHLLRWHRAEQYHEAGVHFQKRVFSENDRHGLLDIRFRNGLIEIPSLVISWHTGSFFRNIIALEQTCPEYGNYFTSYCAFLSQIVTKPADVVLLAKTGILVHHMRSDDEVSALLTKLGRNVDFGINGSDYLNSVCRRMEEHYQSRTNRWMAWLWHNHFSNPWLSLAVLAAAIWQCSGSGLVTSIYWGIGDNVV